MTTCELSVLNHSRYQPHLERALIDVIEHGTDEELAMIAPYLANEEFLARLDSVQDKDIFNDRYRRVIWALGARNTPYTDQLFAWLVTTPSMQGPPGSYGRGMGLPYAIARQSPMSATRARALVWMIPIFASSGTRFYWIPLRAVFSDPGVPAATAAAEFIMAASPSQHREIESQLLGTVINDRLSPNRLWIARALVDFPGLAESMQIAITKAFLGQPKYRQDFDPTTAPPFEEGSTEVLQSLLRLADVAQTKRLTPELHERVRQTVATIQAILRSRGVPTQGAEPIR